jgi:hypothetical protein
MSSEMWQPLDNRHSGQLEVCRLSMRDIIWFRDPSAGEEKASWYYVLPCLAKDQDSNVKTQVLVLQRRKPPPLLMWLKYGK